MSAAVCSYCEKPLEANPTGRPQQYCDDRCRKAASRAEAKRAAEKATVAAHRAIARPETPQRSSYGRDLGDGDPCPLDPMHGQMYVLGKERGGRARQWCPHSAHPGRALYEYDGTTPVAFSAPRSGPDLAASDGGGLEAQGRLEASVADPGVSSAALIPPWLSAASAKAGQPTSKVVAEREPLPRAAAQLAQETAPAP